VVTRVGIVGLGFGAAVHLPAFQSLPGVRVVGVAAQRAEKARATASGLGLEIGGTVDELLAAPLDAVSIALPPDLTATVATRALDLGLAVLAEKPLADSAQRAEDLAVRARGHTAVIDFQFAELDCFRALKGLLDAGDPGNVVSAQIRWRTLSYAHRNASWSWKTDRARHGGVMNLLGSHVLYLVEWLLGPIGALSARFSSAATERFAPPGERAAEDAVQLTATLASGGIVKIELCNAAAESVGQQWSFATPRSRLALESPPGEPMGPLTLTREKAGRREVVATDAGIADADARLEPFRRLAARFVAATQSHASCTPDFAAGARVQRLLEATALSAGGGGALQRVAPGGSR
jgi:predicted dehydrogenase